MESLFPATADWPANHVTRATATTCEFSRDSVRDSLSLALVASALSGATLVMVLAIASAAAWPSFS